MISPILHILSKVLEQNFRACLSKNSFSVHPKIGLNFGHTSEIVIPDCSLENLSANKTNFLHQGNFFLFLIFI